MTGTMLLECDGLEVGTVSVPAFQIALGEIVAVVHPFDDEADGTMLLRLFSGQDASQRVKVHCQVGILDPFHSFPEGKGVSDRPLSNLLVERGLCHPEAYEAIVAAGLQPNLTYQDAQLTNRLLLEMNVSLFRGVQLTMFSTSGLDPLGVDRVLIEARSHWAQCSSLALFHESLASYHESTGLFDRRCDRIIDVKKR